MIYFFEALEITASDEFAMNPGSVDTRQRIQSVWHHVLHA
jgi:hypothetical protein